MVNAWLAPLARAKLLGLIMTLTPSIRPLAAATQLAPPTRSVTTLWKTQLPLQDESIKPGKLSILGSPRLMGLALSNSSWLTSRYKPALTAKSNRGLPAPLLCMFSSESSKSTANSGVAVVNSAELIMAGVQSGCMDFSKAAAPATCGEAKDVPLENTLLLPRSQAPNICTPGAIMSGFMTSSTGGRPGPRELKEAIMSPASAT